MDLSSFAAGLVAYAVSVLAAVVLVFVTYRLNTFLTSRIDEERLLLSGNRSVAIGLGAILLSQAILMRHAVFPTMVVIRDLFLRPVSWGASAWVLGHCLADLALGAIGEADLPLPVTEPKTAPLRRVAEAFYEVGAQLAHFVDARV